jgi:hypothetical protein
VKTPTLVLHSDMDFRVPIDRASSGSARCSITVCRARSCFSERESQSHADRRTETSGREPQLAGVLVR